MKKKLINTKKIVLNFDLYLNILNLFFNFVDLDDYYYFIFFDIFLWKKNLKWNLFKPYNFSFCFRFKETKKWFITRLINNVNKRYIPYNIKNNCKLKFLVWENFNSNQFLIFNKILKKNFIFKNKIFLFTFKEYYYFFRKNQNNIYYLNSNNYFYKYFVKNINLFFKNCIFYYLNFIKLNLNYLKLNNKIFINNNNINFINSLFFLQKINFVYLSKIFNSFLLITLFIFFCLHNYFFIYIILEEKQKKEFFFFIKRLKFNLEFSLFLNTRFKVRLRQRAGENKIFKKLYDIKDVSRLNKKRYILYLNTKYTVLWFFQKKRRTKNQIYLSIIKKNRFKKKFILNLKSFLLNFKKNLLFNSLNILVFNIEFFKKYFFSFIEKKNNVKRIDLDNLYVYYLPSRFKNLTDYNNLLTAEDDFDLWFSEDNLDSLVFYNFSYLSSVNFINRLGNINNFNKIDINTIYNNLMKKPKFAENNNLLKLQNLISLLKLKKNYFVVNNFLNLFLNVYFWLIFFFLLIKKSIKFKINKFMDYTSFLKIVKIILKNNFNLFSISDFVINLYVLTYDNIIIKLSCNFKSLLQEICLYLYYNVFKLLNYSNSSFFSLYNNNLYNNLLKVKSLNDLNYIFKGNLSLDNNFFFCLNLLKQKIGENSLFFYLIKDFFFNCNSLIFIKKYIKLYQSLLDLTFFFFDSFINNLLLNLEHKNKFFYFRYENIIIIGLRNNVSNLNNLYSFIRLIVIYLYFFLRFYFYFFNFYSLNKNSVEIANYVIYKKNNNLIIKSSYFSVYNLLVFYNFIKIKKNNKIIINPANFLLNVSLIRIYNFFYNILLEVKFYFCFLKKATLKFFFNVLIKACYLTMYLKLKLKKKKLSFKYFKIKFKFPLLNSKKNFYINSKELNYFFKNNKQFNLYNLNLILNYLK